MRPPAKIYCRKNDHETHNFSAIPATQCRVEDDDLCYVRQHSELKKLERWIKKECPKAKGWEWHIRVGRILVKIKQMKSLEN